MWSLLKPADWSFLSYSWDSLSSDPVFDEHPKKLGNIVRGELGAFSGNHKNRISGSFAVSSSHVSK